MRLAEPAASVTFRELARTLEELGRANGLDAVGIAAAAPLARAREALEERKAAGLHGGMEFTYRNPERSTTPDRVVPGARAIVVGARRYRSDLPPRPSGDAPTGRVARYAWSDHYARLREALQVIAEELRARGYRAVVVADDNAMVDREVASRAGLGWFGKNANLLLRAPASGRDATDDDRTPRRTGAGAAGLGSWFVLGSVVTDAPLPTQGDVVPDGCGACRRCLDGCPTAAIVAPGVVDARRCLAWLVQQAGTFPREYRVALGDRIYGCDDCQEVCPPNLRADRSTATSPDRSLDASAPPNGTHAEPGPWVPLLELLTADDPTLLDRYGRWYIPGRDPRWLRRNALLALGNVGRADDPAVVAELERHLRHPDPMLRAHAAWAARRLGRQDLLDVLAADPAPEVVAELAAPPPPDRAGA